MSQKAAFFLDRDGTINVDHNYVHRIDEWEWCDGAIEAIKWMNEHDFKVIIVTNQSGISRGKYTLDQVNELHEWVNEQLKMYEAHVDAWYVAPYHPMYTHNGIWPSKDRKPGTGMFKKAIDQFEIDPDRSFMMGDKVSDLVPAVKLGIKPIFIHSRHEPQQDRSWLKMHGLKTYVNIAKALEAHTSHMNSPFKFQNSIKLA